MTHPGYGPGARCSAMVIVLFYVPAAATWATR